MRRRAQLERTSSFALITVCTGNICRSPLAEILFRMKLESVSEYEVASAGLQAVVGSPMDELAARELRRLGGDPTLAIGEQFIEQHAIHGDLILTMTKAQRDDLLSRYPRAARRTFTLSEFALLAAQVSEPVALQELTAYASLHRPSVALTPGDDIRDPYRETRAVHYEVVNAIARRVDEIVAKIA